MQVPSLHNVYGVSFAQVTLDNAVVAAELALEVVDLLEALHVFGKGLVLLDFFDKSTPINKLNEGLFVTVGINVSYHNGPVVGAYAMGTYGPECFLAGAIVVGPLSIRLSLVNVSVV